ncbi:hypothetical protein HA466_0297320 [Hirschfeldia incana]|nr:hypothetical protein HA466_0297320 [Hirschfeldia incana]
MEMGRRDMRRGESTNRSSNKKSGSVVTAKQKKRTLKKLSLADDDERMNRKRQEMMMCYDFPDSDLENEVVSLKKKKKKKKKSSKLLKKSLKEESNVVVHPPHASVPRKLRSAMKKRNLESVSKLSSPSKRLNMDLVKNKENQETDAKAIVSESMLISKDEEEVAETLFGLADMFTESASVDNKTCEPLLSDDDDKDESIEPVVSVLSSDKTKQLDEMPLQQVLNQQSNSVNVTDTPARTMETKAATTSDIEYKSNGLALWPGLSSTIQSRPSSTNLPPWMGQAVSSTKNASPLSVRPRKLKRCASHIYICHLIKALQSSKSNLTELRSSDMSQWRVPNPVTTTTSDFKSKFAPTNRFQNPHLIDFHTTCNPKLVEEDKTQLSLELYGPHTTQKQIYDFLSLSSSNGAAPFTTFPQHPVSAAYNSQLSPPLPSHQMRQMPLHLATSRLQTAFNANQQQQQQLQKRMWATAQYRPLTSGNSVPPIPNPYSKPNLSLNLASSQPLHVASSPRYNNNVYQHERRLMSAAAAMSMSHHHNNNNRSRMVMNRQEHRFPLIYEDTRTPLQLLCNEQS